MSKINELDACIRPREKALSNGIKSLSDVELLAIIIRCGTREFSAIEIAKKLIEEYQGIANLLLADSYSLMKIKGIKKAKAIEILSVLELAKRINYEKGRKISYIKEANDVYKLVKIELENETQEHFVVIYLNIKLAIIKKETIFIGGECSSIVDVNLLYKKALICGARKIICIHNHPSGDCTPSSEDIALTSKLAMVGEILNIELLDHLIIGKNEYYSFKRQKLMAN